MTMNFYATSLAFLSLKDGPPGCAVAGSSVRNARYYLACAMHFCAVEPRLFTYIAHNFLAHAWNVYLWSLQDKLSVFEELRWLLKAMKVLLRLLPALWELAIFQKLPGGPRYYHGIKLNIIEMPFILDVCEASSSIKLHLKELARGLYEFTKPSTALIPGYYLTSDDDARPVGQPGSDQQPQAYRNIQNPTSYSTPTSQDIISLHSLKQETIRELHGCIYHLLQNNESDWTEHNFTTLLETSKSIADHLSKLFCLARNDFDVDRAYVHEITKVSRNLACSHMRLITKCLKEIFLRQIFAVNFRGMAYRNGLAAAMALISGILGTIFSVAFSRHRAREELDFVPRLTLRIFFELSRQLGVVNSEILGGLPAMYVREEILIAACEQPYVSLFTEYESLPRRHSSDREAIEIAIEQIIDLKYVRPIQDWDFELPPMGGCVKEFVFHFAWTSMEYFALYFEYNIPGEGQLSQYTDFIIDLLVIRTSKLLRSHPLYVNLSYTLNVSSFKNESNLTRKFLENFATDDGSSEEDDKLPLFENIEEYVLKDELHFNREDSLFNDEFLNSLLARSSNMATSDPARLESELKPLLLGIKCLFKRQVTMLLTLVTYIREKLASVGVPCKIDGVVINDQVIELLQEAQNAIQPDDQDLVRTIAALQIFDQVFNGGLLTQVLRGTLVQ
ncbi:uncharacterized protein LOC108669559 isoform X2 [Hyalella azteca]|uniref:Uncharacterized protein LOC108669559 isoform X2 n=1 Tax=Hyalella azteca TaxID=294128 RepID=A0A8B7NFN0_HYAAZ|nr:uncharacterized protein LOC108669559 isoform X2 [Hyalella azteca]